MDVPSIKFKYFEKLKLWHDYLSGSSIFENTKKSYWEYEKMILVWAYSESHQHLYTSINNRRIFHAFGLEFDEKEKKLRKIKKKEIGKLNFNDNKRKLYWENLTCKLVGSSGRRINYVMGNLVVKELFIRTGGGGPKKTPSRIRVTARGLLLGELLFEGYCSESYWQKDFKIYKWGYGILRILVIVTISAILLALFNQFHEFISIFLNK